MTITHKRALVTSILFGSLFVFLLVYFIIIGAESFTQEKIHFAITSSLIALAMIGYVILLASTNKKDNIIDERDNYVLKKSYGVGLVLSLMYVFLISIILFITNRNLGVINVSWLWFIGYSTFAFSYFITSFIILYYYNKE
jgi:hypothetical protein